MPQTQETIQIMQIIMQHKKIKKNIKIIRNQIFKLLNYEYFLTKKINLNLFLKSNKYCKKWNEKVCFLLLCDFSKLIFFTSLKRI